MEVLTLKDWTINFVKNKDLIARKLVGFEEKSGFLLFHFKDKDVEYFIHEKLGEETIVAVKRNSNKTVACKATRDNLVFLIKNWGVFRSIEGLSFIFADPSSGQKWLINPFVHSKICDDEALQKGLESMYENTFLP